MNEQGPEKIDGDDMPSMGDLITDTVMASYARGWREGRMAYTEELRKQGVLKEPCDVCGKQGHHDDDHTEPWVEEHPIQGGSIKLIRDAEGNVVPHKKESPFLGDDG